MLSREAFMKEFAGLRRMLEKRRKRYLLIFYVNIVIAALLLVCVTLFPHSILSSLASLLHHTQPVTTLETVSFMFFGMLCAVVLASVPPLRYRGGFSDEYSLQKVILLKICEWLGESTISPSASSFAHSALGSGIFPADAGISERAGIRGSIGEITYSLQEMAVSSAQGCIFRGVFIVCQPVRQRTVLHYASNERSLILHRDYIYTDVLTEAGWKKPRFTEIETLTLLSLACVTTHSTGMSPIISAVWLYSLRLLAERAALLPGTPQRADTLALQAAHTLSESVNTWFSAKSERPALAAEIEYDAQHCPPPDIDSEQQVPSAFDGAFAASVTGDMYVVALPCASPLFATPSLFEPSVSVAQAEFLYDIVQWILQNATPSLVGN